MPKKFAGENSKAAAARARKEAVKEADKSKKKQQEEDAKWAESDKNVLKKLQKKEEQERKRQEQQQKKAETKLLLEKEVDSIKKAGKAPPPPKITRAQIETSKVEIAATSSKKEEQETKIETHLDKPIEENINRVMVDGEEARTVTEAINILSMSDDPVDKHPEKRMKAAYNAYLERRLNELKTESPNLRLSQLKQAIFKEWQKSPENPLNKSQQ